MSERKIKFKYRKKYDATPMRRNLNLDNETPINVELLGGIEEANRIATMLLRTKKAKSKELEKKDLW